MTSEVDRKEKRYLGIREIGCIACLLQGVDGKIPATIHHVNLGDHHGQLRLGDAYTIGLCPWHHQGQPFGGWSAWDCEHRLGPSWEREPNRFRETYGGADALLVLQERLLRQWASRFIIPPDYLRAAA